MSEPIKIVDTGAIDKNEELRGLIPESTYYHSVGITQRVHSKFGPWEANLVGSADQSKGTQYNWEIAQNNNASVDLNEGYFEITGELDVICEVSDAHFNEHTIKVKTEDLLIPSDLWFHSMFSEVQLRIGDAVVSSVLNPVVHNVFRKLMFHGEDKNQLEGFAGTHIFPVVDNNVEKIAYHGGLYNFANSTGILPRELSFTSAARTVKVPFHVKMMLSDLFDTDDLIPIFNQNIRMSLVRSALDYISIGCASPDFKVQLSNITYFQLNLFSYLLEDSNKKTLMNIYSTPRAVVFGARQQVFQTVTSVQQGGQVTINSPSGLLFGAKFLMMYLTKSNTNTNSKTLYTDGNATLANGFLIAPITANLAADKTLERKDITRFTASRYPVFGMGPHAPLNILYNTIKVECGGYTVLYDDVIPIKDVFQAPPSEIVSTAPGIYNDVNLSAWHATNPAVITTRYYTRLYHEYCESCMHTGVQPLAHEEFLNCYPCIMAELSDFSQISTNSFLNINIQNGSYSNTNDYRNPYYIDGNEHKQLNIICYGLRALQMSNGIARLITINNTVINNDMVDDSIEVQ